MLGWYTGPLLARQFGKLPLSVAFVPNTMVPEIVAMVAGENDDGLVRDAQHFDGRQKSPDVAIDRSHAGEVLSRHPLEFLCIQIRYVGVR